MVCVCCIVLLYLFVVECVWLHVVWCLRCARLCFGLVCVAFVLCCCAELLHLMRVALLCVD